MGKFTTILGIAAVSVMCSAGASYALDSFTNTATVDSTTLGPAWVDPSNASHKVMMSAIMGWKPVKGKNPFGDSKHKNNYVAGRSVGLGALTASADGCGSLGANGGIQKNVKITKIGGKAIYTGVTVDDGSRQPGSKAGRDGCGNFSSSPQTSIKSSKTDATGIVTQNIDFLLTSDDPSKDGDAIIGGGEVRFSMIAQSHQVIDFGTKIDQTTELLTTFKNSDGTKDDFNSMQLMELDHRLAGSGFVASPDPEVSKYKQSKKRNLEFDLHIVQDTAIDTDRFIASGGTEGFDFFEIDTNIKIKRSGTKNNDAAPWTQQPNPGGGSGSFGNMPPGFF